jgi:hypothetical protein
MTKKHSVVLIVLSLLLVLSLATYLTVSGEEEPNIPDLEGTWVGGGGDGIRVNKAPGSGETDPLAQRTEAGPSKNMLTFTVVIDFQDGYSFSGTRGTEKLTETLVGVIGSDNETLYLVDEDGYLFGQLLSDDQMELVYLENGEYAQIAGRAIYTRQ